MSWGRRGQRKIRMLHKEKGWGGGGGSILMRHQQRRGADSLDRRLPAPVMMLHAPGSKLPWASFPGNCVTVLGPLPLSFPRGLPDAAVPSPPPPLVSEAYSNPVALSMPPADSGSRVDVHGCLWLQTVRLIDAKLPALVFVATPPPPQPPPPPLSVFEHGSRRSHVYFLNNLGI